MKWRKDNDSYHFRLKYIDWYVILWPQSIGEYKITVCNRYNTVIFSARTRGNLKYSKQQAVRMLANILKQEAERYREEANKIQEYSNTLTKRK